MARQRSAFFGALLAGSAIVAGATFGVVKSADAADQHTASQQAQVEAQLESSALAAAQLPDDSSGASADPETNSSSAASTAPASAGSADTTTASSAAPSSGGSSSAVPSPASPTTADSGATTTSGAISASASPNSTTKPTAPVPASTTAAAPAASADSYRDGQFTAVATYDSPGGPEMLGVTITLKHDHVVKSQLQLLGGAGVSHTYQTLFATGYLPKVLGKDIDTIKLGVVSGSSLTGGGFNDALQKIKTQAHVQA